MVPSIWLTFKVTHVSGLCLVYAYEEKWDTVEDFPNPNFGQTLSSHTTKIGSQNYYEKLNMHLKYAAISYEKYFVPILVPIMMNWLLPSDLDIVRQEAYGIGLAVARRRGRVFRPWLLFSIDAQSEILVHHYSYILPATTYVILADPKSWLILSNMFTLNSYSDEQSLRHFRFLCADICSFFHCMHWSSDRTQHSWYRCDSITGLCLVLCPLSSPCTWHDLETSLSFSMQYAVLSGVFWEVFEAFVKIEGHLIAVLLQQMMAFRAKLHAKRIHSTGGSCSIWYFALV